jgi:hypothetical protein
MPIFGSNVQTTSVGTSAAAVFNPNATPYSTLAGPLKDVTFENTSATVSVFLGSSSVTAATGLVLGPGQQLTYNGFSTPAGSGGTALYAITSSGTATVVVGLATLNTNE